LILTLALFIRIWDFALLVCFEEERLCDTLVGVGRGVVLEISSVVRSVKVRI
jgi:hypothetical protein